MTDTYAYLIREKDWGSDRFLPGVQASEQDLEAAFGAHKAFQAAVEELGARIVGGAALQEAAKYGGVVTPGAGDRLVEDAVYTDSPYADSSELITGFYLVEVSDEAQARTVAAMVPTDNLVEWRKVLPMQG